MLTKYLYGSKVYDLEKNTLTKEDILKKYYNAMPHENVSFKSKEYIIETIDEGNHIRISKRDPEKDWYSTTMFDALEFKTPEDFADLVLNFSEDKAKTEYKKDQKQCLKHFIDLLDSSEKEKMLYNLLTAKFDYGSKDI